MCEVLDVSQECGVATTLAARTVYSGKRRLDKQTGNFAWSPGATWPTNPE